MDPMGRAILDYVKRQGRAADYWKTKTADRLRVFSPMFEEDEIPLRTLIGEPFPWLYIDADTLKQVAENNGYMAEVVAEGEHYDYLARITKKNHI